MKNASASAALSSLILGFTTLRQKFSIEFMDNTYTACQASFILLHSRIHSLGCLSLVCVPDKPIPFFSSNNKMYPYQANIALQIELKLIHALHVNNAIQLHIMQTSAFYNLGSKSALFLPLN